MRFDRATIALEPMTLPNCLDLSLLFLRAHFKPIALGWLSVCVPTCVLSYVLIDRARGNLAWGLVALAFGSAVYSAYLIAGSAQAAFGEPFTFQSAWNRALVDSGRLIRRAVGIRMLELTCYAVATAGFQLITLPRLELLMRPVYLVCTVPMVGLTVRYGFTLEQAVIGRTEKNSSDRQISEIVKNSLVDLLFRWVALTLFSALLWLAFTVGFDQISTVLFQRPLMIGRMEINQTYLDSPAEFFGKILEFFLEDPGIITYLLAMGLLVYPLTRLAWFFCYIDLRVRQDCWDIELQIQHEAERLEGRVST